MEPADAAHQTVGFAREKIWPVSVELDAIDPNKLRDLVDEVVGRHLPADQYRVLMEAEKRERKLFQGLAGLVKQLAGKVRCWWCAMSQHHGKIDFDAINRAAIAAFPAVLARILPSGKQVHKEWVALNPRRADRSLGSFKVNRYNGKWCDFATGDKGGDAVSLVAYVEGISQAEAARRLARMLNIDFGRGSR